MALKDMNSRTAILKAIEEYDELGRHGFLEKYGFGKASQYFLEFNGISYDSKAIVGAAHGYEFPSKHPLKCSEFSGGAATVQQLLEKLGFSVLVLPPK